MSDLITQTAKLVPYAKRPKQAAGFVTAYYYEPLADDAGFGRGNLYIVVEVLVSGRASEEVADLIIDTIGDHYYNQPDSARTDTGARFEDAIRAANQELGAHVNRGNAAWIGKLSAVVAVQIENELHVAQSGSGEAFLYRSQTHARITTPSSSRPSSPTKTFSSISTGQLEIGDRVLLATPALIHQVPLKRLEDIVGQTSPNAAIAEITDLLHEVATERIAALIIEITTPELAALQVRSEHPSEIHLGPPESPLEVAKQATVPLVHSTAQSTKKAAGMVHTSWLGAKPRLRSATLKLAGYMRKLLSTKRGQIGALCVLVIIVAIGLVGILVHVHTSAGAKLVQRYQTGYTNYQHGQQLLAEGQKSAAQTVLKTAGADISALKPNEAALNKALSKSHDLASGEPRSVAALATLINQSLNQLSGLIDVNATTVANLATQNSKLNNFEIYRGKAYIFDATENNQLTIINLTSGSTVTSKAKTEDLGVVAGTTLTAGNTGIFILTATPAVWFYSFSTDSLIKETASGNWPKAQSIGSFGTSLYLLSGDSVIKYVKTAAGFSSGVSDLKTPLTGLPASLAIDGSIYVTTASSLTRYFGGQLVQTLPLPPGLTSPVHLRSTNNASLILAVSPASNRIGLWDATASTVTYKEQIAIKDATTIYAATYDPTSGLVYATTPGKLLSFPYQP